MKEKTLSSEVVYQGKYLKINRDQVELENGFKAVREYIKHPGAAVILAVNENKEIAFVRQYRYAMKQSYLELPAGKRDAGEDPLKTAIRELKEETGYVAGSIELMIEIHPCIGYADEVIYIYIAKDLKQTGAQPDPGEELELEHYKWPAIETMLTNHEIKDAKTLSSLLWYKSFVLNK